MALTYLVFIVFLIFILMALKSNSSAMAWLIILALNISSFGLGYLPDLMLSHLQVYPQIKTYTWKPKNLIVLLGGGETGWGSTETALSPEHYGLTRMLEALKQYQNCKKENVICHILAVGGDPFKKGQSEAMTYKNKLVELGVQAPDIFLEEKSKTTIENGDFAAVIIKKDQYDLKILVTSGFHMMRSLLCFIQSGVTDLQPAPADYLQPVFTTYPNATNLYLVNLSFHEYFGMGQAILKVKNPELYKMTLKYF